jgi:putative copper resistance protein D
MNLLSGNLTDVDPLVSALGTLNKSISFFAAFTVIGFLLATSFLLIEREGKLETSAITLSKTARLIAGIWLVTSAFQILLTLANILGSNLSAAVDATTLRSFITQIDLGRYMAFQTIVIAVLLVALNFIRSVITSVLSLGLALLALVAPVFQSHSASGGSHSLAIGSLVIHVVAL